MPKPTAAANATPMPTSSRRAFLKAGGALGTVAAFAVPVALLPKAEASSIDPVFSAIYEFRAKRAAFYDVLKVQGDYEARCKARGLSFCDPTPESDAIEELRDAASDEDAQAWRDFLNTVPTTREGLCAYLDLLTDMDGYGGGPAPEAEEMEAICGAIRSFVMGGHYA
ncbi:twin-arginine translocation signal domain-containing protein [Xanthobacter autotrophicus]|uniref:twin-arginine translocation signal domain-containing protein n=1 Tax=Xanthobacter autotrophicus TaxID=280 RepID=UPI003727D7BF